MEKNSNLTGKPQTPKLDRRRSVEKMVKLTATITRSNMDELIQIGNGNASAGVRAALASHRILTEQYTENSVVKRLLSK